LSQSPRRELLTTDGTFNIRDFYGLAPTIPYTLTIPPASTTPPVVPEPSTLVLMATGCSSLLGLARSKRLS
jgi:hypothetical protein